MAGFEDDRRFAPARRMLVLGFLSQNVAIGCAFGGLAVTGLAVESRFHTSRATADMALSIAVLTMSLLAPAAGTMIVRFGLRATMIVGVIMSGVGYAALAFAPSILVTLAIIALLVGPGAALFGSIPSSILAGGWFPGAPGKALGLVNVPLFVALIPLLGFAVVEHLGLSQFYLCLAGLHLLLLPFLVAIKEPPFQPDGPDLGATERRPSKHVLGYVLAQLPFWLIVLGDGILNGANITNSAHIVPIAAEGGLAPSAGAILLSVGGGASILGSIFSGFLSDRFGAARTLAMVSFGSAASWIILASTGWYPGLMLAMVLCGSCGAAVFPPTNVLLTQFYGLPALPQALGLLSTLTLPITFVLSPAVGALHDVFGKYGLISASLAGACGVVGLIFLLMNRGGGGAQVAVARLGEQRPAGQSLS